MKNTENNRSYAISEEQALNVISCNIENTNDLCKVLLKLVGDFEDKSDRKLSLISFGPKVSNFSNKTGWKNERSIKFRWAETEVIERLVE